MSDHISKEELIVRGSFEHGRTLAVRPNIIMVLKIHSRDIQLRQFELLMGLHGKRKLEGFMQCGGSQKVTDRQIFIVGVQESSRVLISVDSIIPVILPKKRRCTLLYLDISDPAVYWH